MAQSTPKILVVDDYGPNRTIYVDALRRIPNVEVIATATGHEALELARQGGFALYLLDIHMPDMDGFELASLLRQESEGEPIPIVFVTADDSREREYVLRGYRMGATDFLAQATTRTEILVQKARFFTQLFRRRQELQRDVDDVRRENQALLTQLEEYKQQQEILRAQATHDVLTKLPNRALFQDRLKAAVARARRGRQHLALAYVDLDGFKAINDRHGHATGDALLVSVANRMLKAVRETDTVARLGGDEFAMLFEGLESAGGADYVAAKAFGKLTQPLVLRSEADQQPVTVRPGASMGVAIYPDQADDAAQLIQRADMTMYEAKRAGGGVRLYGVDKRTEPLVPLQLVRARQERKGTER
jgi:diguanylate cyclase (GGDEF)-like protein